MNDSLPSAIRVRESPEEVRYILPRRRLDRRRLLRGVCLVFMSIVLLGMCVYVSFFPGFGLGQMPWLGWLFALKAVPMALIGLVFLYLGLSLLFGHAEIRLRGDRLIASEHAGPLRQSRVRELISLQRFVVIDSSAERDYYSLRWNQELRWAMMMASDGRAGPLKAIRRLMHGQANEYWLRLYAAVLTDPSGELSVLLAECERSGALIVAGGYPRAWLAALANDLSRRCQRQLNALGSQSGEQSLPVAEKHLEELEQLDLDRLPAKARLTLERFQEGLTLSLQPCREYHVAWPFYRQLLYTGALIVLLPPALIIAALFQLVPWELCIIGSMALPLVFGPVVAFSIYPLLDETRSEARIGVVGDELLLLRVGVFSSERRLWRRRQLSTIRVDYKKCTYGWAPELRIHCVDGRKLGFFAGRQETELRWLAAVLRNALKVEGEGSRKVSIR